MAGAHGPRRALASRLTPPRPALAALGVAVIASDRESAPVPDQSRARIAEIESLRGIAIALVVLFHLDGMAAGRSFAVPRAVSLPGAFVRQPSRR